VVWVMEVIQVTEWVMAAILSTTIMDSITGTVVNQLNQLIVCQHFSIKRLIIS
jgi:hypothetical protein